jgi:hypothetical protein
MMMLSQPTSGEEEKRLRGSSIFTIKETRVRERERDRRERSTGRESFGKAALYSQETSTPTGNDGTHDAKCSGMLFFGKA